MYANDADPETWTGGAATDYGERYTSIASFCVPKIGKVYTTPNTASMRNEGPEPVPRCGYW